LLFQDRFPHSLFKCCRNWALGFLRRGSVSILARPFSRREEVSFISVRQTISHMSQHLVFLCSGTAPCGHQLIQFSLSVRIECSFAKNRWSHSNATCALVHAACKFVRRLQYGHCSERSLTLWKDWSTFFHLFLPFFQLLLHQLLSHLVL